MVSSTTSRTLDSSPAVTIYIDLPFDRSSTLGTWWTREHSQFAASNVVSGKPCTVVIKIRFEGSTLGMLNLSWEISNSVVILN